MVWGAGEEHPTKGDGVPSPQVNKVDAVHCNMHRTFHASLKVSVGVLPCV